MKGIILDKIEESSGKCYLTKIRLGEYVNALQEDYREYDIQREIVKNIYLDNLIQTVLEKKHIPPIVLIVNEKNFQVFNGTFEADMFKILDGLQRTFRLKAIYETFELLKVEISKNDKIFELGMLQISRTYKEELERINSSTVFFTKALSFLKENEKKLSLFDAAFENYQWFEIWTGLTPEEEVNKMLVLNAGHKPVKTKHQLELLFLNILTRMKKVKSDEFKLLREKEVSSVFYSKQRKPGEFHFSHLITSLLSFAEAKPLTTNVDLVQKKQTDYFPDEIFDIYMGYEFLNQLVDVLLEIDKSLVNIPGADGTKWLGRETSLVGIFAAAGRYAQEYKKTPFEALSHLKTVVCANPSSLALAEFEHERNSVNLAKVNIGSINKRAVFNGVFDILTGKEDVIHWADYFIKGQEV